METDKQLLDVLTREGVLISVSIKFWRAQKHLKWEDLGIDPDRTTDRLISLGRKRLLPQSALKRFTLIESRAHALVENNTFPFLGGIGRFLPNRKLAEVSSKLAELETEFKAEHQGFLREYASLRDQALREWREVAAKHATDPARLLAAIEQAFPGPIAMSEKYFGFSTQMFQIQVPKSLSLDLVEMGDQRALAEAREQASREAAGKIRAGTDSFVRDCISTLRKQAADLCAEMLASINGSENGVHGKTLNRLTKFIDKFKGLNFAGDSQLEQILEDTKKELLSRSAEEYRNDAAGSAKLEEGLRALGEKARELARQDSSEIVERFGALGKRRLILAA